MTFSRSPWRLAARRTGLALAAAAPLALGACGGFGEAMTAHTDTVARAAGKELKVEEAAALLATNPQVPADPQVVQALANIWVEYVLLATAIAEDASLGAVDLEKFTLPAREQALIMKLREQVVQPDTVFGETELAQSWATQGPGVEVRARHILLRVPAEATPAQRDSVLQLAASLQQRAAAGEDFAALAQQFSQDPGSAARGGDLGFFGRGRMVAPFEEAAFALQTGEVSEVVESPFGYHIIRVEERRQPELGEQREEFRQFLVQRAQQEAETAYLDSLAAAANVQVQPNAVAVVKEIATRPEAALRGRAAAREIATYQGGELTSGEFSEFIRVQPPQMQSAFATASDEQIQSVIEQLARKELLLAQAQQRDISLTREEEEAIRAEARRAIDELLQASGLGQAAGRPVTAANIDARVEQLLQEALAGRQQIVPLGPLGFALRELYPSEVNEGTFAQVIARMEAIRAAQPAPAGVPGTAPQPGQPVTPPVTPPDTAR